MLTMYATMHARGVAGISVVPDCCQARLSPVRESSTIRRLKETDSVGEIPRWPSNVRSFCLNPIVCSAV